MANWSREDIPEEYAFIGRRSALSERPEISMTEARFFSTSSRVIPMARHPKVMLSCPEMDFTKAALTPSMMGVEVAYMVPAEGGRWPVNIFIKVDFPEPLVPIIPTASPV